MPQDFRLLERNHNHMHSNGSRGKLPLDYFLLIFVLAVPFWLIGGNKLPLPFNLPASALGTFVPMSAASILSYRREGVNGVKELLKKALDYQKTANKIWCLPALLLAPLIYVSSYAIMRWMGLPLPSPIQVPFLAAPVLFFMFFIGDTGEELGWSGYAIDPMQNRWGAFKASLILGIVWVIWHAIPWLQTGNSPTWVVWQSGKSIVMRIVIVWLYNNTGKSVLAATLYHATDNVSWTLFPNFGSHYNPLITGMITALASVFVIFGWGPKTLTQYRGPRAVRSQGKT